MGGSTPSPRRAPSVDDLVAGVRGGDRAALGQAITLVESDLPEHVERAQRMLTALLPATGAAHRVGISGVPGVGKSTFIDALGVLLTAGARRWPCWRWIPPAP
jgi:LAO/AO transport system kinase